jgi:hypothetical protein
VGAVEDQQYPTTSSDCTRGPGALPTSSGESVGCVCRPPPHDLGESS